MKYYKVNLYDVDYSQYEDGQKLHVEEIIVKEGLVFAKELLTGYKIEILPNEAWNHLGGLDTIFIDKELYEETGHHLVVFEKDFVPENFITAEDIDDYLEAFDNSKYSVIYSEIKEKTYGIEERQAATSLKQKIKMVRGTKK